MIYKFSHAGYDFYMEISDGVWNCVKSGEPAPMAGGYYRLSGLLSLKGL